MNPGDRGIDVSKFQHPNGAAINYTAVAAAGYKFAYIELTDGTYTSNEYCVQDARGFQAAGMDTGAYMFFEPDQVQDEQTSDFSKLYTAIGGWTLPIMIDVEVQSSQGWATLAKLVGDQRSNLVGSTGADVGMYANLNFYGNLPGCPWGWDLWLADPSHPAAPSVPCLLQQAGTVNVPGITGPVDIDIWRGGTVPAPTPPPAPQPKKGIPTMYITAQLNEQWLCSGSTALHIKTSNDLNAYLAAGVPVIDISASQFAEYTQVG